MQPIPNGLSYGLKPRQSKYGDGTFPCYADQFDLLPRDQWKPVSLNRHVPLIYGQLDGMCTSNGATMAMMVERSIRNRPTNPILSPEYLYYMHSRWGTGSTLGENLRWLKDHGTLTLGQAGPDGKSYDDSTETRERLAGENRMLEWVDLDADFDAVATALQRKKPCLIGVRWPGGGGHAVCATALCRVRGDGRVPEWALRGPNSWEESWGEDPGLTFQDQAWLREHDHRQLAGGFFTLTERQCADFNTFGCWAVGTSV